MKNKWQNSPPDYDQWISAKNEGYWWIKTTIPSFQERGLTFPSISIYEIVRIVLETKEGKLFLNDRGRLCFQYNHSTKTIYCDNMADAHEWQPVTQYND